MKTIEDVGITGYGGYIPLYRVRASEIARVWGRSPRRLPVEEKAVAGPDEDAVTIAVEAARNALRMAQIPPEEIGAVYVGTESKPYAVKPCGTIVAEAIGAAPETMSADFEFACKAGTEAFQACAGLVGSGMVKYAMAVGVDTAQGRPGDELEYTAACGGAAFILGSDAKEAVALIEGTYSYVTDTPDFWRREHQYYPRHTGRFTGEPAYFKHIVAAGEGLMEELNLKPKDFDYVILHQPNRKFPVKACKALGFPIEKIKPGLLSPEIGNAYAGSSPLGLAATLDVAKPGERLLLVSFGSGAGSDAISLLVQDKILEKRKRVPSIGSFVRRKEYLDYASYARYRGKIRMG